MSQHTPAPWNVTTTEKGGIWIYRQTDNGGVLSTVCDSDAPAEWPLSEANTALIAAAPELLAACESAANWCREYEIQNNGDEGAAAIVAQLREAIAKATGQPAHS